MPSNSSVSHGANINWKLNKAKNMNRMKNHTRVDEMKGFFSRSFFVWIRILCISNKRSQRISNIYLKICCCCCCCVALLLLFIGIWIYLFCFWRNYYVCVWVCRVFVRRWTTAVHSKALFLASSWAQSVCRVHTVSVRLCLMLLWLLYSAGMRDWIAR